jgi:short-subunit dehydrogenase
MKSNWLAGKSVLLTGASSGIGRDMTKLLICNFGCRVIGIGLNEAKMQTLAVELGAQADLFDYRLFDVSLRENWERFADELVNKGQAIDILINNAGIMPRFASIEAELPDIHHIVRRVMATNFYSTVDAVSLILPLLRRSETPAIINISSASAIAAMPGTAAYSAAKAAQRFFTECLSAELKGEVYVACVCPGFVRTELFREQKKGLSDRRLDYFYLPSDKAARKIVRGLSRQRRSITPGLDAKLIHFLYRILGIRSLDLFACLIKKVNAELFSDVFKSS